MMQTISDEDTIEIQGGSLGDWFWYGVGYVAQTIANARACSPCDPTLSMT